MMVLRRFVTVSATVVAATSDGDDGDDEDDDIVGTFVDSVQEFNPISIKKSTQSSIGRNRLSSFRSQSSQKLSLSRIVSSINDSIDRLQQHYWQSRSILMFTKNRIAIINVQVLNRNHPLQLLLLLLLSKTTTTTTTSYRTDSYNSKLDNLGDNDDDDDDDGDGNFDDNDVENGDGNDDEHCSRSCGSENQSKIPLDNLNNDNDHHLFGFEQNHSGDDCVGWIHRNPKQYFKTAIFDQKSRRSNERENIDIDLIRYVSHRSEYFVESKLPSINYTLLLSLSISVRSTSSSSTSSTSSSHSTESPLFLLSSLILIINFFHKICSEFISSNLRDNHHHYFHHRSCYQYHRPEFLLLNKQNTADDRKRATKCEQTFPPVTLKRSDEIDYSISSSLAPISSKTIIETSSSTYRIKSLSFIRLFLFLISIVSSLLIENFSSQKFSILEQKRKRRRRRWRRRKIEIISQSNCNYPPALIVRIFIMIIIVNHLFLSSFHSISLLVDAFNENERDEHEPENKSDAYSDAGSNITKILNAFFDSGYDKRVRPEYGGPPVQVGVSMHIIGISSVSEVQMDFTSDFYFRQLWKDNRLVFTPVGGIDNLVVGAEVAQKIWVPDTFFANEKVASFHSATTPNTFLRILHTGEVYRSIRLTVTASCPMNLQYFPMDSQLCTIEIESYGYSMADIVYIWAKGKESIGMSKGLELPQFKVVGYRQSMKIETLSTGNYSRLVCEIQFERSMGYYLIQIYIPASLIVIISWVSFWLHRNATPARVALGVTTVLTMTTLMSSTNAALPKISYIKSIDVFLGTCFVMVFASLLEYATVGYLGKRIAMRKTRSQQLAKLAQEHRNRCAAAAAAAAAAASGPRGGSLNLNLSGLGGMNLSSTAPTAVVNSSSNQQMQNNSNSIASGGMLGGDDDSNDQSEPPIVPPPPMPMPSGGPTGMMCQQTDLSATLHRPLKPMSLHQPLERYATIGTPRIVHHPSLNCPSTCPQAYGRQDVRLQRGTSLIADSDCTAQRQSFSANKSIYNAHHPSDHSAIPMSGATCFGMMPMRPNTPNPLPTVNDPSTANLLGTAMPQTNPPIGASPTINLHKRHHNQQHQQQLQQDLDNCDADNLSLNGPNSQHLRQQQQQQFLQQQNSFGPKNPNKLFGVSPSDIDKYSRVVFPVCFVCFNLMYWVIYLHISSQMIEDLIPAN